MANWNLIEIFKELLPEFITHLTLLYPWQTLQFVGRLRLISKNWYTQLDLQQVSNIMEIPPVHFATATNNADEIQRLNLELNCSLLSPDKYSQIPAFYAIGCKSNAVIRRLKVAFALKTNDNINFEKRFYTLKEFNHIIETESIDELENYLINNKIILTGEFMARCENYSTPPFKNFVKYVYKNGLRHQLDERIYLNKEITPSFLWTCQNYIDINTGNEIDKTFLTLPIRHSSLNTIKLLLEYPNIDINNIQFTLIPIFTVFEHKRMDCLQLFIDAGADIKLKNYLGETALHYAAATDFSEGIIYLLNAGLNVNEQIKNNVKYDPVNFSLYTPLHFATRYNNFDAIKILLDHGADKTLLTSNGLTAYDIAKQNDYLDILDLLKL